MIWHWVDIVHSNPSKARLLLFTVIPQFVRAEPPAAILQYTDLEQN